MEFASIRKLATVQVMKHVLPAEEVLKQNCAAKVLRIPGFESFMRGVILVNLGVMILETNRYASEDMADEGLHWTEVLGWCSLALFVFELVARLLAQQCAFWYDPWDVADFVIVVSDLVLSVAGILLGDFFPVSALRIFRLTKLARFTKMLRAFPELRMLLAGLAASVRAIFWGTVLTMLFLLVWAIMAVLILHPLAQSIDFGDCERCPRAYGSVQSALLTFFQQSVAGDSWGQVTIPIIERYPATVLFFLPVYLSIGLAVLNLILGVIVNLAQQAYDDQQELDSAEKALERISEQSNILEICRRMDEDGSGTLTIDEVRAKFMEEGGEFRRSALALGLTEEDFDIVWSTMDVDRSGFVSYKEFIVCLSEVTDSDQKFMLTYIKHYITWMKNALDQHMKKNHRDVQAFEKRLADTLDKVVDQQESVLQPFQEFTAQKTAVVQAENQLRSNVGGVHTETHAMQKMLQDVGDEISRLRTELTVSLAKSPQEGVPTTTLRHGESAAVATYVGKQASFSISDQSPLGMAPSSGAEPACQSESMPAKGFSSTPGPMTGAARQKFQI